MSIVRGEPIWLELDTTDLARAQAFYGGLFGWTFTDNGEEFGHYNLVRVDGKLVGGAMQIDPVMMAGAVDGFAISLHTADAEATVAAAAAHGGTVAVPAMPVGESGTMAFFLDPAGAGIGAWQGAEMPGIEARNVPGAPSWFEVMTSDFDAASAFYREVFGWELHPMGAQQGEWRYATLGEGQDARAGLCDATAMLDGGPSYWRVYFDTSDCDASVAKVIELGGSLLDGPEDTPFGRIATVVDDQGARFQLRQPPVWA